MKKIYFNHIVGNIHPVYQEMLDNELNGFEYINKNDFGNTYQNNVLSKKNIFKSYLIFFLDKIYILPNITFRKLPGDIIYSCQSIPLFGDFILDLDCYEGLNRFSNKLSNNYFNKFIVKFFLRQKRCKKIIFWSDNAKIGFHKYFGNILDTKIEVVYPAIKVQHTTDEVLKWKNEDNINILFVGRYFERKGGIILLEVFDKLLKKYSNIKLTIISNVDIKIRNNYKENLNINFLGLLPREKVIDNFKKADIYLMPTFNEIFGFVFLEAFVYGAVPISMDTFAINNIIDDGKDGFVIKYKNRFHDDSYNFIDSYNFNIDILLDKINKEEKLDIIDMIYSKLEILILDKNLRKRFILNGYEKVKKGKFSNEFRNNILKTILEK